MAEERAKLLAVGATATVRVDAGGAEEYRLLPRVREQMRRRRGRGGTGASGDEGKA